MSRKANRLIDEQSPYLLQHAYNPVDWRAWNEESFALARDQDKPIFLSVGYSTCHWCHVMEHDSFENEEVARLMNEAFVSIKVDREERPDVDNIYMTVCQMITGHGGWPLTVIMTPDKKPFFAATFIPSQSQYGRVGMLDLIPRITDIWKNRRGEVDNSAEEIIGALKQSVPSGVGGEPTAAILKEAFVQFSGRFDSHNGGFSESPKFPTPHNLNFLLRYALREEDTPARDMVTKTLREMRKGGIFDHVGKGFHRYATDTAWFLPHFEKMLYDQALLALAYTEAYAATGEIEFADTAREIFEYVGRDMTSPEGVFFSAEDADSEGEEGKFYVWSTDEAAAVLGSDAELFFRLHAFEADGNFLDEATRKPTGDNIIHLPAALSELAEQHEMAREELKAFLQKTYAALFAVREKRVRPGLDDKVLTDWNGLMISAFAVAARVLNDETYGDTARRAADFLLEKMRKPDGRLLHRYRAGDAAIDGLFDDYAFLVQGLLDLYEAVFDPRYLEAARELTGIAVKHFWDEDEGGFFFTADDGEELILRRKEVYDGAQPSGNSVALMNFLRLGRMTGETDYEEKGRKLAAAFGETLRAMPSAHAQFLSGLDFAFGPSLEIVIAGEPDADDTRALLGVVRETYLPRSVILLRDASGRIATLAPYTETQKPVDGKAAAYVCRNFACEAPVTDPAALKELLQKAAGENR